MKNIFIVFCCLAIGCLFVMGCEPAAAGEMKPIQKDCVQKEGPCQKDVAITPVQKCPGPVQKCCVAPICCCPKKCCPPKCVIIFDSKCKRVYKNPCTYEVAVVMKTCGWRIRACRVKKSLGCL